MFNKKACAQIHAHWTVAFMQLVVGVVWSFALWLPGIRKTPILSNVSFRTCMQAVHIICHIVAYSLADTAMMGSLRLILWRACTRVSRGLEYIF